MKRLALGACVLLASALTLAAVDRPVITVLDFKTNNVAEGDMRVFVSLFSAALFETQQYTVIDVSQRDALLKEVAFSMQDCSDESCQLEIGKQLAAEMIVVGDLGKLGSRLTVSARLLETATGKTLRTASGIYSTMDDLVDELSTLAAKLAGVAPSQPGGTEVAGPGSSGPTAPAEPAAEAASPAPAESSVETAPAPPAESTAAAAPAKAEEAAKPAAARARSVPRARRIAGLSLAAAGLASGGLGAYLILAADEYRTHAVASAWEAYSDARYDPAMTREGNLAAFDELWASYDTAERSYRIKAVLGFATAGGGLALSVAGLLLALIPGKSASPVAQVSLIPVLGTDGRVVDLGWRVRY
jgi:hypothetical protein